MTTAGAARGGGPAAADLVAGLPLYAHVTASLGDEAVMIARVPDFGVEGYDIIGPRPLMEALRAKLVAAGAGACAPLRPATA